MAASSRASRASGWPDDVGEVGPGPRPGTAATTGGGRGRQRRAVLGRGVPVDDVAQAAGAVHRRPRRRAGPRRRSRPARRRGRAPARAAASTAGSTPCTPRTRPSSASSPRWTTSRASPPRITPGRRQHGDGDGQVEARPALGDRGRRQVDGDPVRRHRHPAVRRGRPHPVGRLRARGIGHAADREVRQPLRDVRLDVDQRCRRARTGPPTGCAPAPGSRPDPHDVPHDGRPTGPAQDADHVDPHLRDPRTGRRARRGTPPRAAAAASPWRRSPPRPARRSPRTGGS